MICRDIEKLDDKFKLQVKMFLTRLEQLGLKYLVSETLRSQDVQNAYFAQGRQTLEVVNLLREKAGLWAISKDENTKKVTWSIKSKHTEGNAIDIVPSKEGQFWWIAPLVKWQEIADVAESFGIESGYYWRENRDCPHFQLSTRSTDI